MKNTTIAAILSVSVWGCSPGDAEARRGDDGRTGADDTGSAEWVSTAPGGTEVTMRPERYPVVVGATDFHITLDRAVPEGTVVSIDIVSPEMPSMGILRYPAEALREGTPDEKRGALVGLLRSGSIEGVVYAGAELLEDLNSHSPMDRTFAAHVLRDAAIPSFYRQAIQLLNDPSPQVRAAAVEAAAAMSHPPLWPMVVDALRDPELSAAASEALIGAGTAAVPSLVKGFERHEQDRHFRLLALRILGLIRGEEVIRSVFPLINLEYREERHAAFMALVSCGFRPEEDQQEVLTKQLRRETRDAAENLDGPAEARVLQDALAEEIEQVRYRIFLLVSVLYPEADTMTTWDNYSSGISERRAYALEVLENIVTNEERAWLFPVLEDLGTVDRLERLGREWGVAPQGFTPQLASILEVGALSDWTLLSARQLASAMNIGGVTLPEEDATSFDRTLRLAPSTSSRTCRITSSRPWRLA